MAPLRCLTDGSIAVGHLANQKRVKQAHDQKSVTQRMRRKLAGIFCFVVNFVFFQEPLAHYGSWFFFPWRLANPNKNKVLPQAVFWCFFQRCSRPKAEPQSKEKTIGVGSLGLLLRNGPANNDSNNGNKHVGMLKIIPDSSNTKTKFYRG